MRSFRLLLWAMPPAALALVLAFAHPRADLSTSGTAELSDYGRVPDFSLIERSGREIRHRDLAGSPWVANFVFTRCSGSCPTLAAQMARVQSALGSTVRIVSFSVDPEHDTPSVLSEYAARLGASDRWLFVTGNPSDLRKLVTEGFHLAAAGDGGRNSDPGAITHSDRVALIDRDLRVRRYYLGTEEGWIEELRRDLERIEAG